MLFRSGLLVPPFHLDGLALRLFHNSRCRFNGMADADLADGKREIDNDHSMASGPADQGPMVNHLFEGDRNGGLETLYHHSERIADEKAMDSGFIQEFRSGVIISGQHRDFLSTLFHALESSDVDP